MMMIVLRINAWLLAAAVTFATLGPPRYRPATNFSHDFEHLLAFVLVGLAFGFAYPRHRLLAAPISVAAIGVVEVLQLVMPGRHARFEDFLVNTLAACAGLAVAAGLDWAAQRLRLIAKTP
jgi:VanZ family protein